MDVETGIRPLRRLVHGAICGAALGAAAFLHASPAPGHLLPVGLAGAILFLTAAWVAAGWALAELGFALVPRRWRPTRRTTLFVLLTAVSWLASHRLDVGRLNVDHLRFQVELLALVIGALVLHRLDGHASAGSRRALRGLAAGVLLVTLVSGAFSASGLLRSDLGSPRAGLGRPSVVIVLVDTLRVDRLSLFGAERRTSPHLEALAAESFLFRRAYCPSAWTSPSVASLFTGLTVREHGVARFLGGLGLRGVTLAERLSQAGYRTFASSANVLVSPRYGFHRGFEQLRAPPGLAFDRTRIGFLLRKLIERFRLNRLHAAQIRLEGWMRGAGEGPHQREWSRVVTDLGSFLDGVDDEESFFAYLHLIEPHHPYDAPDPFGGAFRSSSRNAAMMPPEMPRPPYRMVLDAAGHPLVPDLLTRYDEEILAADHAVGTIVGELSRRGRLDDTIFVVTTDHGEEFQDHGGWLHGHQCFDEVVRSMLLVRLPGGDVRGSSDIPVSIRSLAPFLAERAGLSSWVASGDPPLDEVIASPGAPASPAMVELHPFAPGQNSCFAILDGGWKLVRHHNGDESAEEWLFDLDRDPHERADVAAHHPDVRERLARVLDSRVPPTAPAARTAPAAGGDLQDLRALGYVQ